MSQVRTSTFDPIDRLGPTGRLDEFVVMYQRWACLLFLHWEVPVEALRPLVPSPLEIDTFEGRAFVGLVPFTMTGIRPRFLPAVPWLSDFHEINVRTYVHRGGRDPGVWFLSLDAANAVAVRLARWTYGLPYRYARMSLNGRPGRGGEPAPDDATGVIRYTSDRRGPGPVPVWCDLRYRPTGTPHPAAPGTLEHFLAERYILYTEWGGGLYRGRVHHAPYPLQTAEVESLDEGLIAAAGVARPSTPPLAHFARAVEVEIFPLHRVSDGAPSGVGRDRPEDTIGVEFRRRSTASSEEPAGG
jgi:hypothetical protein